MFVKWVDIFLLFPFYVTSNYCPPAAISQAILTLDKLTKGTPAGYNYNTKAILHPFTYVCTDNLRSISNP